MSFREKHEGREKMTMSRMFCEPYCNKPIEQLLQAFRLEIEKYPLGGYRHYTPKQLLEHYNIEVKLADKLRNATKTERAELYSYVYDKLFEKVSYHPQLFRKSAPTLRLKRVSKDVAFLRRFVRADSIFLEVGPGDGLLSFEMAKYLRKVYAIDVSEVITKQAEFPSNFELKLSDGSSVDIPAETVDVAYSNQLVEHVHPEDVIFQLQGIYQALVPGGIYICITPHRFGGPYDVSRFFDKEAKGLHLREYTNGELRNLLIEAGFSNVYCPKKIRGKEIRFPLWPAISLETFIKPFPHRSRRKMYLKLKRWLAIRLIAQK